MKRLKRFFLLLYGLSISWFISHRSDCSQAMNVFVRFPYITRLIELYGCTELQKLALGNYVQTSSLAYLTIGKEYYETFVFMIDFQSRQYIFQNSSILEYSGQTCKHYSLPKVLKTYSSNIYLSKVFGDILEKVIYLAFSSVSTKQRKADFIVQFFSSSWVLIIHGIKIKTILPKLSFGLIVQMLGRVSLIDWLFFFF